MKRTLLLILGILLSAAPAYLPLQAKAQFNYAGPDLSITLSPVHPEPRDVVHLHAESSLIDLTSNTVTWYSDGLQVSSGRGLVDFETTAGALGSETSVTALVSASDGPISSEAIIRPTEVDLIWEADSYVPPFYRGRALPSAGSKLHMQAVPRLMGQDGKLVSEDDITYTWRRNGYVIAKASGTGKSRATVDAPSLFGTDTMTVEVKSRDGELSGSASARVTSREPVLVLYEDHPLFGVLYNRALGAQSSIPEVEMSFISVPYFAPALPLGLSFAWKVNGTGIASDASRPDEITINASNSNGLALIELSLTSATNFFLDSYRSWGVALSSNGLGVADPFRTQ